MRMFFGSQTGLKHREREVDHAYLTAYTPTCNFANSTSTYEQTLHARCIVSTRSPYPNVPRWTRLWIGSPA